MRESAPSLTRVIFVKELVDILRDRRALFFAFVLPLGLYPLLFLSFSAVSQKSEPSALLKVGFSGDYEEFIPYLRDQEILVDEVTLLPDAVRKNDLALFLQFGPPAGGLDAAEAAPEDPAGAAGAVKRVILYYASTSPVSTEARRRIHGVFDSYRNDLLRRRFAARGAALGPGLAVEAVDLATAEEKSGALLGRLLPLVLVLLLLSGGSFAAIDLVAGEKERGTLETLYIHPVSAGSIVRAKFLVVLCVSLISVLVNAAGMLLSWLAGFGPERFGGADFSLPPARTLAVIALLAAPLAVFTSAILLAVSACARSFREAQTYLLPLTLVALLGVLLASSPHVELESLVALVPIANASLGIRRALEGRLTVAGFTAVLAASSLLAGLALWKAAQLLRREDVVLNLEPPPLARNGNAETRARRGLFFAWPMLLCTYFAAHWTQGKHPIAGLAVTLWGFVLLPALAYPFLVKVPFREALAWRSPGARNLLLVVPAAAAALPAITFYALVQSSFFPVPEAFAESTRKLFTETSPALLLFLVAVSPAICEELLWRGAVQGELEPRRRTARTVVTIGLLFGLFHWSTHRFVPAALLGMVLALVRTRTRSIFPCMLFHGVYNAGLLSVAWWGVRAGLDEETSARRLTHPALVLVALAVLAACLWGLRPRDPGGPGTARDE